MAARDGGGRLQSGAWILSEMVPDSTATDLASHRWEPGLRLVPGVVLAPHWDRLDALLPGLQQATLVAVPAHQVLVGIDERRAIPGDGPRRVRRRWGNRWPARAAYIRNVPSRIVGTAVVAMALVATACGGDASPGASPSPTPSPVSTISPAASDPAAIDDCLTPSIQTVSLEASDGAPLVGAVLGTGSRGVLLAHELNSNLCAWFPFARRLSEAGYLVLAIDMRGFGASGFAPGGRYDLDVVAGVEELQEHGAGRVALMGASLGATAVLTAAPQVGETLAGVISLSGPASYGGLDAEAAVAELDAPMLFVAAEGDGRFPQDARDLNRAAPEDLATLEILPGFDHGTNLLRFELAKTTGNLVLSFLRDAFSGPEENQP